MHISGFHRRLLAPFAWLVPLATMFSVELARAEPVTDDLVSGAQVTTRNGCALLQVYFHVRVRYIGHFPQDHGDELRITLQPIDLSVLSQLRLVRREGVMVDNSGLADIQAVTATLDDAAVGPTLRIQFSRPVAYEVGQLGRFDSIAVALPRTGSSAICKLRDFADINAPQANGPANEQGSAVLSTRSKKVSGDKISTANMKLIEASMDEARYAIRKNRYSEAIALLQKVLKFPENRYSADAQEMLGEARQKAGQTAQARAEFEEYLRRYPNGDGTARMTQRLGSLAGGGNPPPPGRLRGSVGGAEEPAGAGVNTGMRQSIWSMSGSISSFYIRDDSYNTLKNIAIAPNPSADPDAHRVHQDTFLTNFDLRGSVDNEQTRTKFKLAGSDEHRLRPDQPDVDRYGISSAYIETTLKEWDVTARFGRQTRNTGGVIGRFDGGVVSWQATDIFRLNAVGGATAWSRYDAPFKDGRYLVGASIDVARVIDGLDTSIFAIQQNDRWLLDRRAIGGEFRYFNHDISALGMIDYDIHFQRLNAAILSGSWTFEDKSILSGTIDHRRVPYLSSWNALQGQPYLTLFDMLRFNSEQDVRRFAIDRTPVYESAMASYSRPLNENFSVNVDATVTRLSGTIASGGVDGTVPSGTEYYLSGQLIGSNVFRPGDMFSGAVRYANLSDSQVYFVDLNSGYPWNDDIRISPRLRAGYRSGKLISLKETTILPSLLIDYRLTKNLLLEGEIGTKWIWSSADGVRSTTKDLYLTLGLRSDFATDGMYRCAGNLAPCSGLLFGPPQVDGAQAKHERVYYSDALFDDAAPAVTSAFVLEGGVRYWLNRGDNRYDYFADETPTTRVSRLSYTNLTSNSGELFFRGDARRGLIRNMFLKGYVGGGAIRQGKLYDEDFPPFVGLYSKTISNSSGRALYGSIDLGYNIYTDELLRLGAFVGFHSWFESVNASGCAQLGVNPACAVPLPGSLKLITERDRWNSFRIGAVVDLNLTDRLKWTGEVALVSTSQRAQDTHYLTFGDDPAKGHGGGFQAETLLKYQVTDRLSFGVGLRWWRFNTHSVDMYGQLLRYRTDRYGVFAQASYRMNWGDFLIDQNDAP
jgi:hypothetical protein